MAVSPGIYVTETDNSVTTPQAGITRGVMLGTASRGPLNIPTLVRSETELVRMFGPPLLEDAGLQSARQFLKQADQLYYVRIANGATTASYPIPGTVGGVAAVKATGTITFTGNTNPADGDTIKIHSSLPSVQISNDNLGAYNTNITLTGTNVSQRISAPATMTCGTSTTHASAHIVFLTKPTSGDSIQLNDGSSSLTFVFGSGTGVVVTIGADAYEAASNFAAAVNAQAGFAITGAYLTQTVVFEFDNNGAYTAGHMPVLIGTTTLDTLVNFISAIAATGLPYDIANTTTTVAQLTLTAQVGGVIGNTGLTKTGGANTTLVGLSDGVDASGGSVGTSMILSALNPGTWGNSLRVQLTSPTTMLNTTTDDPTNDPVSNRFDITVYEQATDGTETRVERYTNLSLWPSSARYITRVLMYGVRGEVDISKYVQAVVSDTAKTAVSGSYQFGTSPGVRGTNGGGTYARETTTVTIAGAGTLASVSPVIQGGRVVAYTVLNGGSGYVQGTTTATVHGDGVGALATVTVSGGAVTAVAPTIINNVAQTGGLVAADYIGTVSGQTATGLKSLRNKDTIYFNVLAIPGVTHKDVISEVYTLSAYRGDFLYVQDYPFGLSPAQAVDWHNGSLVSVANAPVTPLDNSYAALYGGWVLVSDPYNGQDVWLPPSGFVMAAMAYTDKTQGPWWASAGTIRGAVSAIKLEYSPQQEDRDLLCGLDTNNRINPLVSFSSDIAIWGNRTLQRKRSALESVHVRRMLLYAEKVCSDAVRVLVFNPNDQDSWRSFTQLCNDRLEGIKQGRGFREFKVICDATTNTDSKTMRGKLLVWPNDAAEMIAIDFVVNAAGFGLAESA